VLSLVKGQYDIIGCAFAQGPGTIVKDKELIVPFRAHGCEGDVVAFWAREKANPRPAEQGFVAVPTANADFHIA
jgi:hypothetical protein